LQSFVVLPDIRTCYTSVAGVGGARGRDRTGTTLFKSRDFRTTSAFAANVKHVVCGLEHAFTLA